MSGQQKVVVIALGGNAMMQPGQKGTFQEQIANISTACDEILKIYQAGYKLILSTGNGPQVGQIKKTSQMCKDKVPELNLHTSGALSQGQIGYWFQNVLGNKLRAAGEKANVCTIITQTIVDKNDPAFKNPSKPIGAFVSEAEAEQMRKEGKIVKDDAGRGLREFVASPIPKKIVEFDQIKALIDLNTLVISTIGGGIPVIEEENGQLRGVDSVIDKDRATSLLSVTLKSDYLMILTDVPNAYINYKQPNQEKLETITLERAIELEKQGHFKAGSMGPKVRAAIEFVQATGNPAIITSLSTAVDALAGKCGTRIVKSL